MLDLLVHNATLPDGCTPMPLAVLHLEGRPTHTVVMQGNEPGT